MESTKTMKLNKVNPDGSISHIMAYLCEIDQNEKLDPRIAYMFCRCPYPLTIGYRFTHTGNGYYTGVCKDCGTKIGMHIGDNLMPIR